MRHDSFLKSACPSPDDYVKSFSEPVAVVVTITEPFQVYTVKLRWLHIYLEEHPNTNIHAYIACQLGVRYPITRKLNQLVAEGLDFDQVVDVITTLPRQLLLFWPRLII